MRGSTHTVRLTKPPMAGSRLSAQPCRRSMPPQVDKNSAPKLSTVWAPRSSYVGTPSTPKTCRQAARREVAPLIGSKKVASLPSAFMKAEMSAPVAPVRLLPSQATFLAPLMALTAAAWASSQVFAAPATIGPAKRSGLYVACRPAKPIEQSRPLLPGWLRLPSSLMMRPSRFLASTPQWAEHSLHCVANQVGTPGTICSGCTT